LAVERRVLVAIALAERGQLPNLVPVLARRLDCTPEALWLQLGRCGGAGTSRARSSG
jgi:hypothetical protein